MEEQRLSFKITIRLSLIEKAALLRLVKRDERAPSDVIRRLIRQAGKKTRFVGVRKR